MATKHKAANAKKTKSGPAGGRSRARIQKARKDTAKVKPAAKAKKPTLAPLAVVTTTAEAAAPTGKTVLERPSATVESVSLGQVVVITDKLCPDVDAIGEVISIQGRSDSRISLMSVLLHSGHVVRVFRDGLRPGTADEVTRWLESNGAGKVVMLESTPEERRVAVRRLLIAAAVVVAIGASVALYLNANAWAFWA